jgi:CBS domain-containing protein
MRNIVVDGSGKRRGTFDIKHGGLLPIVDLARYAALKGDISLNGTLPRLRASAEEGIFKEETARILEEAYELFSALRLEHQVAQLERGNEPDDRLDPEELDPLTRRYLRDAFREVGAVQRSLAGGLPSRR